MDNSERERERRARLYSEGKHRAIEKPLGRGTDGTVWQTNCVTAIKACDDYKRYSTERDCYVLFRDRGIRELCGFTIPRLIDFNDNLMVVEMDVVEPPYIIDFGKAYLNTTPPHYSATTMSEWYAEKKELWGEEWPTVRSIITRLRALGIYHMDPRPGNIMPANWDPPLD